MESLKFKLKQRALHGLTNEVTLKQYKVAINRFSAWAKCTHHVRLASDVTDPTVLVQEYADHLLRDGYAPDTIHSYLAPVASGFGLSLSEIKKPKRSASGITKTRKADANAQGRRELYAEENRRLTTAARAIGIRRAELAALTGDCLVQDADGSLSVRVRRGKGGRLQMQRILPQDSLVVTALFEGVGPRQRVFTRAELNNKIALHGLRRLHAQEAYDYYMGEIRKGNRQKLINELKANFLTYHAQKPGPAGARRFAAQYARFCADLEKGRGRYRLRGQNLVRAERANRPVIYDRVALMATSVFHLAHWRNDVTARNYMI